MLSFFLTCKRSSGTDSVRGELLQEHDCFQSIIQRFLSVVRCHCHRGLRKLRIYLFQLFTDKGSFFLKLKWGGGGGGGGGGLEILEKQGAENKMHLKKASLLP